TRGARRSAARAIRLCSPGGPGLTTTAVEWFDRITRAGCPRRQRPGGWQARRTCCASPAADALKSACDDPSPRPGPPALRPGALPVARTTNSGRDGAVVRPLAVVQGELGHYGMYVRCKSPLRHV